uniref:Uncharacterized protein n=1 Tax=Glossina brevipalpis TaxID=37001 RepID=A0A1A9WEP0_9MUSC
MGSYSKESWSKVEIIQYWAFESLEVLRSSAQKVAVYSVKELSWYYSFHPLGDQIVNETCRFPKNGLNEKKDVDDVVGAQISAYTSLRMLIEGLLAYRPAIENEQYIFSRMSFESHYNLSWCED